MATKNYKETLQLPSTSFPMKADLSQKEPVLVEKWNQEGVYKKMLSSDERANEASHQSFVLHDGPPYANGNIHIGHALNKILKDVVVKHKNLKGAQTEFIPGWDCHGLPIELGVEKQLREQKIPKQTLSIREIRKRCREYALNWVDQQRKQFQRLGILADWESPYLTMDSAYVAQMVRELGKIAESGALYRSNKPVYWCASCQTALAEAEIEYKNHVSDSIYISFRLEESSLAKIQTQWTQLKGLPQLPVSLVIWTTTPWTLPANLALSVHPRLSYQAWKVDGLPGFSSGHVLIVAEDLGASFREQVQKTFPESQWEPLKGDSLQGQTLEGLLTRHPFIDRMSPVILGQHVTAETGTGIVHTAPGHGADDYVVGKKYNLDVYAPVDAQGRYTDAVPLWAGQKAFDCNSQIVDLLKQKGNLLHHEKYSHSYPHCWRCSQPVMFRATPQWFIAMDQETSSTPGTTLRGRALEEIQKVRWTPSWGINRIESMIQNRPDWCISRQRIWGVPITIFTCMKCDTAQLDLKLFQHVAQMIAEKGPEVWFEKESVELLPQGYHCSCGGREFSKEKDILDVWFDSGISHAVVLGARDRWPADLYLEGSDQHRGWFQTSLLTACLTRGKAPYKQVLTHGFVNDAEGKKMSKSKGNVTDPMEFSKKYGAEILRMWVVLEDYRNDVNFSLETIDRISDGYRKIRNTLRFLLGNLIGFDPQQKLPHHKLLQLDQWALSKTYELSEMLLKYYEDFDFHGVYDGLVQFCISELSSKYFDVLKDRLYTSAPHSPERQSSQSALYEIGHVLVRLMSPMLSFTAEEVWGYLKEFEKTSDDFKKSVFELNYISTKEAPSSWKKAAEAIDGIFSLREPVNKAIENVRTRGEVGHNLETHIKIKLNPSSPLLKALSNLEEPLQKLFIVSKVEIVSTDEVALGETEVDVKKADGQKCDRCWVYSKEVGQNSEHPSLCFRCGEVVTAMGLTP